MEKMVKFFMYVMDTNGTVQADRYMPKISINMDPKAPKGIIAEFNPMTGIRVHMMPLVVDLLIKELNVRDFSILGKAFLMACAHEWRHMQQELCWDEDLPSVSFKAKAQNGVHPDMDAYREDPGEADARAFAELTAVNASEKLIQALGRLCWMLIHRAQRAAK